MLRQLASAPAKAARMAGRASRTGAVAPFLQPISSAAASSPLRSVVAASATAAVRSRQAASAASHRWYSSESDASKKADAAASDSTEAKEAEAEEAGESLSAADAAALRKDLETKSKEAVDWKVFLPLFLLILRLPSAMAALTQPGQVPPLRRRLPKPTGAYAA